MAWCLQAVQLKRPHAAGGETWLFARTPQRVELYRPSRQAGDAWLRDGKTYYYQKLFRADRKIVEYAREGLLALAIPVTWQHEAWIVDPGVLQSLATKDEHIVDGHPAQELHGQADGIQYSITWLNDVQLPVHSDKQDRAGHHEVTDLVTVQRLDTSLALPDTSRDESSISPISATVNATPLSCANNRNYPVATTITTTKLPHFAGASVHGRVTSSETFLGQAGCHQTVI